MQRDSSSNECLYRNPPEVRDGFTHTKASDVYQLGLMALELALGEVPDLEDKNLRKSQVLLQVYGRVDQLFGGEYREFCEKCCATDPNHRASLEQLLSEPFLQNGATKK